MEFGKRFWENSILGNGSSVLTKRRLHATALASGALRVFSN